MVPRRISKPFYRSKQWQKCRAGYIKSVGELCERCLSKGKIKRGYIVHHKNYITEDNIGDPTITLNWDNLEYLCHDCHNEEHFGRAEVMNEDVTFDSRGQLIKKSDR